MMFLCESFSRVRQAFRFNFSLFPDKTCGTGAFKAMKRRLYHKNKGKLREYRTLHKPQAFKTHVTKKKKKHKTRSSHKFILN